MTFYRRILLLFSVVSIVIVTALAGNVAMAVTPDGETPANEGVCDPLMSATKGLYGLCVAYCEAQDLDEIGDKETPNNKILNNYRKKMQAGDPDMPCLKPECPCWTAEEFASVTANAVNTNACTISDTVALLRNAGPTQFAQAVPATPLCRFTDRAVTPNISRRFAGEEAISVLQAQSCYSQIVEACAVLPLP